MSRYDYADPATDPAYCDGLARDNDGSLPDESCLWCGHVLPDDGPSTLYCSLRCAIAAVDDSRLED